jgi:hypothetical protein
MEIVSHDELRRFAYNYYEDATKPNTFLLYEE